MSFKRCKTIIVENNMIYNTNDNPAVYAEHIESIIINNNTIRVDDNRRDNGMKNKEVSVPLMNITKTGVQKVSDNYIVVM